MTEDLKRFQDLGFEDFRRMALDESLSKHEKVGFPDSYREGREEAIVADIVAKLPALSASRKIIIDVGPGCSDVPRLLIEMCERQRHELVLVDSPEMLLHLPNKPFVMKVEGRFPDDEPLSDRRGSADAVIVYSVLHYVFTEGNMWTFVDRVLDLLAPGGVALLGDIPNVSMRKRFFSSEAGTAFHRAFTGSDEIPVVEFNKIEANQIDDAVVLAILARARAQGFHAYVAPQPKELPMANRREDVLLVRP